jgi:integrase
VPRARSKANKGLPKGVRIRHGSYTFRIGGRELALCRVEEGEGALYRELAKLHAENADLASMAKAIGAFKLAYLPTLAYSTQVEHGRLLDKFAKTFEAFRVDQVKPFHIHQLLESKWPTQITARKHAKARLSTFFTWAVAKGLRNDNPCRDLKVKDAPRHKSKWTVESYHRIREQQPPMLQCFMDLAFLLSQRSTDVRTLRWRQIDGKCIRIEPTKTQKSSGQAVLIPITPAIAEVLERAKSLGKIKPLPGADAPVIQQRDGSPYGRFGIRSAMDRAAAKAGYPEGGYTAKDLRPFAATCAKAQGFTLEQLQVQLAHTSIGTTEGYIQQHHIPVSEVALTLPRKPKDGRD